MADSMIESLWLNSAVGLGKKAVLDPSEAGVGAAIDLSAIPEATLAWLIRVGRLAALVHDLGHGPFSHTFDSFAPLRDQLPRMLEDPSLSAIAPLGEVMRKWGKKTDKPEKDVANVRLPHEVISCLFFAKIWHDLQQNSESELDGDVPVAVSAAILGIPQTEARQLIPGREAWLPLLHDIVASAPADADRMDYLERDSRAIGVSYGLFDRGRVLKTMLCYQDGEGPHLTYRLGLKYSGLPAVENLVQARYEMFVQVYYHKTNHAVSLMLERVAEKGAASSFEVLNETDFPGLCEQYRTLSDDRFIRILRGDDSDYPSVAVEITDLATAIDDRHLWKRIQEYDNYSVAEKVYESLRERHSGCAADILLCKSEPRATKDLENGASLLERQSDGVYHAIGAKAFLGSTIVKALDDAGRQIVRIYLTRSDPKLAQSLRDQAKAISDGMSPEVDDVDAA